MLSIFVNHKSNQVVQPTSSFDALMRLSNLDDCIQDALSTREKLTIQINDLLKKYQPDLAKINSVSQADESVASTNRALLSIRKQLKTAQSRRVELQSSLRLRRNAISNGLLSQEKSKVHLQSARSEFASRACLHREVKSDLSGQIRRICEDLNQVYPVDPVPQKTLSFTVCGLPLPNATSPSTDPATTAAALGHVAHAVHLISLYLSTPLPYPITPYGSNSTIYDPISTSLHSSAARTFPLYQKGAVAYRFEYGVFLLNTDIDLLMSRQGIRVVDIRHTLPNLKYLLTVLTEGKGEMPGRKGGKFRVGLESPVSESEEGKPKVEELDGRLVVDFKRYGKGKEAVGRVRSPLGRENGTLTSKVR